MSEYFVTLSIKNNKILQRMQELGYKSVADFCRVSGLSYRYVSELIRLTQKAMYDNGGWVSLALRIAHWLDCEPEDLWTPQQSKLQFRKNHFSKAVAEADLQKIASANPERKVLEEQTHSAQIEAIKKALTHVTSDRDVKVIKMRYGLAPYDRDYTLDEIAQELGTKKQRVSQIEQAAIQKMKKAFVVNREQKMEELL